jgi:choline dehydrogenase-like flavoprotein
MSPGPEVDTDAEVDAWIRNTAVTVNHPLGTCAMGRSPDAVLAPDLKVLGVEKLRVVDASALRKRRVAGTLHWADGVG